MRLLSRFTFATYHMCCLPHSGEALHKHSTAHMDAHIMCRFCCALNSAIHVFMYGYYTWAALGVRSNVVKQMVTMSQMLQFVALISQVRLNPTIGTTVGDSLPA